MKILRRLKSPGATAAELLDIHDRQVRAVLGLNEHVQRSAFHIILGRDYESYDKALAFLGREALETRRVHLCQKFATKTIKKTQDMQTGFAQWTKCHYHRLKLKATRTEQDSNPHLSKQGLGDMGSHLYHI